MEARKRRGDLMEEQHTSKRQTRSSANQAALGEPESSPQRRQLRGTETPPRQRSQDDPKSAKPNKSAKPLTKKADVVPHLEQAKAQTQSIGANAGNGIKKEHDDEARSTEPIWQAEEIRLAEANRRQEARRQIERLLLAEERRTQGEQQAEETRRTEENEHRTEVDEGAEEELRSKKDQQAEEERLKEKERQENAKRLAVVATRVVEEEQQFAAEKQSTKGRERGQKRRAQEEQRAKEEEYERVRVQEEQRARDEARRAQDAEDEKRRAEKEQQAENEQRAEEEREAEVERRASDKKQASKDKTKAKRNEPIPLSAPRRSLRPHVQKRRFVDETEEEMDSDDYIDSDEDNRLRSDNGAEEEEEDAGSGYESGEDVERGEWEWGERVPRPSANDYPHKMWLQQRSTKIAAKCDELAQRGLSKVTRVLYAPGLVRWEEFCDEHYSGNYLIRPPKVAHYLKDRIFSASTKARVKGHNHDGAIGRTKADPAVDPEAAKAEAAKIRSRFNAAMREYEDSGYYFYLPPSEQSVHACMNILAHEWRYQTDKGKNNAQRPSHAQVVIQAIEGYLRSLVRTNGVMTSIYTGRRASETSNKTKRRYVRKAGSSNQTQIKTTTTILNKATTQAHRYKSAPVFPRDKKPISKTDPSPRPSLSSNKASSEGSAATREAMYNAADFLRMMDVFWEVPVETGLRDRAAFSLRHQLFLQDQDHRQMDLADCFAESFDITLRGNPYKIHGMALAMRGGAILPDGNTPVAIALRHKDFRRCSVGAVAFHLLERFQSRQEPLPDFANSTEWPQVKLLKGAKKLEEVSYSWLYSGALYAFKASGIDLHRFTMRGCDAGAKELFEMGFHIQKPARISHKGVEIRGTLAMAGYPNAPYDLKRDYLIPPLELQRQIFPIIEELHGNMTPEEWKAYCDNVMQDKEAIPNTDKQTVRERRIAAAQVSHDSYLETARLNVLHLLLWFRRVILQDTCLFLNNGDVNGLIMSPVFQSPEFEKYKTDLVKAIADDVGPTRDYGEGPITFKSSEPMQGDETTSGPSAPVKDMQRVQQREQQEQREQWRPVRQQERQQAKEKELGADNSSRESMNTLEHLDPLDLEESDDGDDYEEYEDCEEYMDNEPRDRDVRARSEPQDHEARQEQLKEYLQEHLRNQLQDYMHQQLQDFMNQQLQDHLQDQHQMYQNQMEPLQEQLEEQAEQLRQLQIQVHQNQQIAQQQIREIQLQALEQKHTLYSIIQDLREDLQEGIHSTQVEGLELREEVQRALRTKQVQMTRQLEDHCRAMASVLGGSDAPLSPLSQATADEAGTLINGSVSMVVPHPTLPAALVGQTSSTSSPPSPSRMEVDGQGQGRDQEQDEYRSSASSPTHENSPVQHRPQPSLSFRQYRTARR